MDLALSSPVQYVQRVGPRMAALLHKLGVDTVYNLLTYIPFRYNDYSLLSPVARVQPGETVTARGTLDSIRTFTTKNGKRLVTGRLRDDSGIIDLIWFNQTYLVKVLHPGDLLRISGKVDWFGQKIVFFSPEYEIVTGDTSLHTGRLVPVYPETGGLSSKWLRGRINFVLEACLPEVSEWLPEQIIKNEHLLGLQEAIRTIHFPETTDAANRARERLAFDELFLLILAAKQQKLRLQTTQKARALSVTRAEKDAFLHALPFTLTADQVTAFSDISTALASSVPMNRLLEGDVGSGKTVVAAGAMHAAFVNKCGSVLMAPTQILAMQHYETVSALLSPLGVRVGLITGSKKSDKPHDILIGTHALLTAKNLPKRIGLVVIDEQQRFGVKQREALSKLGPAGYTPHLLTMTATPIPRTLAQTVFADLDLSVLTSLPHGRKPVKTWLVPSKKRAGAYRWIEEELKKTGMQAFIVCPLIDESESLNSVKAATAEYKTLTADIFPTLRIGLLHGRMKADEKSKILTDFRNRRYDMLVTTPVVEVGIDIPGASIIMIEAAERFGLSQLHQLRGRVGRNDKPAYCLLFTENETDAVHTRLTAMETVHNGPLLAELDLTLRGPGELLGTRQHGLSGLTLARLTDTEMVARAKRSVQLVMSKDPVLAAFPHLRERIEKSTIQAVYS